MTCTVTLVMDKSSPDSDKCYICLSRLHKQAVGSLENCEHVFCLQCILQWSQTSNTCPVDRISFAYIHQRRCPGGDVQKKIKVRMKKQDEEEEEEEGSGAVICEECGRSDRRHRLLVCIQCDSGYHVDCLTPSLNTRPEGDWICPECAVSPQRTGSSRQYCPCTDGSTVVEEEISDGELTDLLAEVDETTSTSSRLRPSTVNRPSSSAERRHSRRIQNRASSDPDARPQTSWHVPKYLLKAADEGASPRHSDTSSSASSVKSKSRERKKRAASAPHMNQRRRRGSPSDS